MIEYSLLRKDHSGTIKGFEEMGKFNKLREMYDWYDNEPVCLGGEDFYLSHFQELSTERMVEGGNIPATAIRAYASDLGLGGDAYWIFYYMIRGIDDYLLAREAEKRDKESKAQKAQAKRGGK